MASSLLSLGEQFKLAWRASFKAPFKRFGQYSPYLLINSRVKDSNASVWLWTLAGINGCCACFTWEKVSSKSKSPCFMLRLNLSPVACWVSTLSTTVGWGSISEPTNVPEIEPCFFCSLMGRCAKSFFFFFFFKHLFYSLIQFKLWTKIFNPNSLQR